MSANSLHSLDFTSRQLIHPACKAQKPGFYEIWGLVTTNIGINPVSNPYPKHRNRVSMRFGV